jgi:Flp pilus assembly protein TadG
MKCRVLTRRRGFFHDEHGAGLVEFAMVSGVFTIILLGFVEAGFAAWSKNSVFSDAREGARFAMVRGSTATAHVATNDSVAAYVRSKTSLDSIRVTTTWHPDNAAGSTVWVHVEHDVPRRGPFIRAHMDSSTSKMVITY